MTTTPEGMIKKLVKELFKKHGVYYFMPVQTGYGTAGLDFHCVYRGYAFCVETKAPGKKPTPRQLQTIGEIEKAGGICFVVSGVDSLRDVENWLNAMRAEQ